MLYTGGAGRDSDILLHCSICRQESGNLDLTNGWDNVFSTATSDRVLVVRKGVLGAGRTYTFSLSATDTSGQEGYAGRRYDVFTTYPVRLSTVVRCFRELLDGAEVVISGLTLREGAI